MRCRYTGRSCVAGPMPGHPMVRKCYCGVTFSEDLRHSVHQFGQLLRLILSQILPKSRMDVQAKRFFPGARAWSTRAALT